MSVPSDEATAALAAMRASRERLAAAADCPPARHLAFAGLLGALVACMAAPPMFMVLIEAVVLCGVAAVVAWDRRRTGMFINGYRAGRTRILTFVLLIFALSLMGLGAWLKFAYGLWQAPIGLGIVTVVVAYFGSVQWQRIYLRELQETP